MFTCMYISGLLMIGTPDILVPITNAQQIYIKNESVNIAIRGNHPVVIPNPDNLSLEKFLIVCEEQAVNKINFD